MAIEAEYSSVVRVKQTLSDSFLSGANSVVYDGLNSGKVINASTTVPATKVSAFEQALTAGAATIDLTALTGLNGASVDGTGLKVQMFKVKAPSTNTGAITLTDGASNGYELGGDGWTMAIQPGAEMTFYGDDETPDIGASASDIDLSGTGTETVDVIVVMG